MSREKVKRDLQMRSEKAILLRTMQPPRTDEM